jgi:hypothetical protein
MPKKPRRQALKTNTESEMEPPATVRSEPMGPQTEGGGATTRVEATLPMRVVVEFAEVKLIVQVFDGMTVVQLMNEATQQAAKHRKLKGLVFRKVVEVLLHGAALDEDYEVRYVQTRFNPF